MPTMNRTLESYMIYLTQDLKIADTCKSINNDLLKGITDKTHFYDEMAKYFTREYPNTPFFINETDPTQVALLKKIINSLENAERVFRQIENLDINRERWTVEIMTDTVRIGYGAVDEALQLINHSNAEIQEIVGSYICRWH
jgi:hypothetical protein